MCQAKNYRLETEGTENVSMVYDTSAPKELLKVSDSFGGGKDNNTRRERQAPPMVVEGKVHENYYFETESESDKGDYEASDEDRQLNREYVNACKNIFV